MRRRRTGWRCPRCQTPAARKKARNAHQREMYHKYYKKARKRYGSGCLVSVIESALILVAVLYLLESIL